MNMGVHNNSKTIRKKRNKKNKVLAEVESSEPSPIVVAAPKPKKVKTKKNHQKPTTEHKAAPRIIDIEKIERELQEVNNSNDSIPRKLRKKVRKLEYLKKIFGQMKNTEESLKPADEDQMETLNNSDDDEDDENQLIVNKKDTSNNKNMDTSDVKENVKDTLNNKEKIETMKGIKRFVVFVGNLPKSVTEEDIKTHFHKAGKIKSVRIPEVKENRKNGFAFVELEDNVSFEKTLSMHHTMLGNKRINVLYTNPDGKNLDKKEIMKKNAKFDAMRKAGILTGSVAQNKKRSFRRKKKRLAEEKAANK